MYRPSLDNTQAFFLLAIAEWGNGDRDRSSMDMGVAVRMATLLKLHREETYALLPDTEAEQLVRAESARRTFWMIQSQENLHSGYSTPAPFSLDDITAYLPCDESDFAFGVVPATRSALPGTPPALANPSLATGPGRCLFATLIQAHNLWGQVARRAGRPGLGSDDGAPWMAGGNHSRMIASLRRWEEEMPPRHKWSVWNLRGWKAESLHLAYLSVVMVLRLSNIVIRRIYIDQIIRTLSSTTEDALPQEGQATNEFWRGMSHDLFANVVELHEQVEAYFSVRSRDEGFPAILVFCVYICGSLASYLWRHPQLCPHIAPSEAEGMAMGSLRVLSELHEAWPTSARWQRGLQQIASPLSNTTSPVAGKHPGGAAVSIEQDSSGLDAAGNTTADGPDDQFEAELAAFLNGDLHYDVLEGLGTSAGQFD
ncbi:putative transcriptional regulatory protein [Colletotrichum siamense]|uniref:Transcriptional regulatory protein n=1 Tax=Colletotrichum siamense TaxID=690259 RepID=A0A9P5K3U2_COLSI|nr:putative transcriptional regulatory protein [Colletotrichum siamense]KAF4857581.1 putative transcriptional regulatory protein [Colletotrichum siamense]